MSPPGSHGARSAQVHRRLRALHAHLEEIADPDELPRLALERRLLDEALATGFPDPGERALLSLPDPLGLGGTPQRPGGGAPSLPA